MSPLLAGGFLTTGPPGKSSRVTLSEKFGFVFFKSHRYCGFWPKPSRVWVRIRDTMEDFFILFSKAVAKESIPTSSPFRQVFFCASLSEGQWFRGPSFMQRSCLISTLLWSGLCLSPGIGKLVKAQALKIFRPLGIGWLMVSSRIYSFATCLLLLQYCDW